MSKQKVQKAGIAKCPTGVTGLDEITRGGLPRGRPTLVCGAAGCGKTLLAMEFIVRGIQQFGENGVFMSFEETESELTDNVASLGFDLRKLSAGKKLFLDHVHIERSEIEMTGEYNLEGLFVRLGSAIREVRAQRVVLDSIEALFAALPNDAILRAELRRLFTWLKKQNVTAIITGEQGRNSLTRHGLEEYVSDCVIFLDHRVVEQVATRRLRIVKYRGSAHGTNEYPTMIDTDGLSVLPISSLGLDYRVTKQRVSTGVPGLDKMFGGQGYYRGSSVLISGMAGTGKSSLAALFAVAACRRGEKCLYLAFEESPDQIVRNMASIGVNLGKWLKDGRLKIHASRPALLGLEQHLVMIHKMIESLQPDAVVMDPVTNLNLIGSQLEITSMLTRVVDFLKQRHVTAVFTSLTIGGQADEQTNARISSLMDTWLLVRQMEEAGDRKRLLYVLKSRGMSHSSRVIEFRLTDHGIELEAAAAPAGAKERGA